MIRFRPWVSGSEGSFLAITNTTLYPVTCLGCIFSVGGFVGSGGEHYLAAVNDAVSPGTGFTGSWSDGFQSPTCSTLILCSDLTPIIRGGSRLRRSARTDLCGGRSAMIVPTATARNFLRKPLVNRSEMRSSNRL